MDLGVSVITSKSSNEHNCTYLYQQTIRPQLSLFVLFIIIFVIILLYIVSMPVHDVIVVDILLNGKIVMFTRYKYDPLLFYLSLKIFCSSNERSHFLCLRVQLTLQDAKAQSSCKSDLKIGEEPFFLLASVALRIITKDLFPLCTLKSKEHNPYHRIPFETFKEVKVLLKVNEVLAKITFELREA